MTEQTDNKPGKVTRPGWGTDATARAVSTETKAMDGAKIIACNSQSERAVTGIQKGDRKKE